MGKRNLRKIPALLLDRIRTFDQDDVVVACVKKISPHTVDHYVHLGLRFVEGKLVTPPPTVPDASAGRYSRANIYGYEKKRRDLPMVPTTFEVESPNWGDSSNGTHIVSWTRDVYQVDFYPPKQVELSVAILQSGGQEYLVKFAIDQVLNRRTNNFERELFYNLNLLQENIGAADVFPSAASLAEYAATVRVDWQLLPPGTVDEVVERILRGQRNVSPEQEAIMRGRIQVMAGLQPLAYITGTDGFLRYFGAKLGEDLVVFENIRYGNALYVMHEDWQELSKRSRIDLLNGPRDAFERVEHRDGWKAELKKIIEAYRERPA